MTLVLAALVTGLLAVLPSLVVPRRRRSLSLLRAEAETLAALPEGAAKESLRGVVEKGAAEYAEFTQGSARARQFRARLVALNKAMFAAAGLAALLQLVSTSRPETFGTASNVIAPAAAGFVWVLVVVTWVNATLIVSSIAAERNLPRWKVMLFKW